MIRATALTVALIFYQPNPFFMVYTLILAITLIIVIGLLIDYFRPCLDITVGDDGIYEIWLWYNEYEDNLVRKSRIKLVRL